MIYLINFFDIYDRKSEKISLVSLFRKWLYSLLRLGEHDWEELLDAIKYNKIEEIETKLEEKNDPKESCYQLINFSQNFWVAFNSFKEIFSKSFSSDSTFFNEPFTVFDIIIQE